MEDSQRAFDALYQRVWQLREAVRADVERVRPLLETVHPSRRPGAENLLAYLAFRQHDLRDLQPRLAECGVSSLGRAEGHVLQTLDAVVYVLYHLAGRPRDDAGAPAPPDRAKFSEGNRLLAEHADQLFGPLHGQRDVRIMVTMPSEAATDRGLVEELLREGMDCMRINCAHDDASVWEQMIARLREAEAATKRTCRVAMDLGGPKLRTGPLEPGPAVRWVQPRRDAFGRAIELARVMLVAPNTPLPADDSETTTFTVAEEWLSRRQVGDEIELRDASGSKRTWNVIAIEPFGCMATANQTTYLTPGMVLTCHGPDAKDETSIAPFPPREGLLVLKAGEHLKVMRNVEPGHPADPNDPNSIATIGCTIPEVFDDVEVGHAIWFDDGKIGGEVVEITPDYALVRINQARPKGEKLRADKGINFPDSLLKLSALTEQDRLDLQFAQGHADIVELSFANSAADVDLLHKHLAQQPGDPPDVILKIETPRAFAHLPEMLLAAMRSPRCGVMIARGDLAVESGFERLAEVQEEILWLCEAAHVPVIWATQVLESLAKAGQPSRAEVTDAAMGHRAECVMLNKGPHVLQAVRALDDIMRRMRSHQWKKQPMLRQLRLATEFFARCEQSAGN